MTQEQIISRIEEIEKEISRRYAEQPDFTNDSEWGIDFNAETKWYRANIRDLSREKDNLKSQLRVLKNFEVKVGDGVTISCWTDCLAFTVIARTAKTITIQRDIATRTDNNGMSDCQDYSYERNPNGEVRTMRWSDKKHCWVDGCYHGHIGRHEYYDYSF